ncbi:TetR family transcriptional regulator [Diaphorobacter caeni]|uniref:TetR family transcriptional regulator n=1 Tax=Diaphorobacter caeni TaxID=2784387 RepID=UPI00188EE196|nr:TetR family transcriptional regulator [Diaphorobacter caeni]MBF5004775.1 TetR family transcriptional regulator [Diaphorobacter caeni]
MARRTKAEADETRTRLLDAAEEVFFEKGVSRTSLGDIAQRAGATRGAVYWHFKDKVDVFNSVLNRVCMPFDEICDDMYGDLEPLDRIRKSIRNVFENVALDDRRRKIFDTAVFKMEYVGELAAVRERHVEAEEVSRAKFTDDLRAAALQLNVTLPMPADIAAQGLHALFVGLIHGWVLNEGSFPLTDAGCMSVDAYLSGLGFAPHLSRVSTSGPPS